MKLKMLVEDFKQQREAETLREEYRGITGGLVKMMAHPEMWCGPSSFVREEEADYGIDP